MDVTGAIPSHIVGDYGWRNHHGGSSNNVDHDTILRSLSDIRMEAKEIEADLLQTAAANAAVVAKDFADTTFRLHENIRNAADMLLASSNLTQAQVAAQGAATADRFAVAALAAANNTSAIVLAGERQTATILAAMSATELRGVQDRLDDYRHRSHRHEAEISFGNRLSVFQSQLNDFAQDQRTTNQAINFGSGRIGPQNATQNQVR